MPPSPSSGITASDSQRKKWKHINTTIMMKKFSLLFRYKSQPIEMNKISYGYRINSKCVQFEKSKGRGTALKWSKRKSGV